MLPFLGIGTETLAQDIHRRPWFRAGETGVGIRHWLKQTELAAGLRRATLGSRTLDCGKGEPKNEGIKVFWIPAKLLGDDGPTHTFRAQGCHGLSQYLGELSLHWFGFTGAPVPPYLDAEFAVVPVADEPEPVESMR